MAELSISQHQKHELSTIVIHRCNTCGTPGIWKCDQEAKLYPEWVKIMLPKNNPLIGQPVGDICPGCGENRVPNIVHGKSNIKNVYLTGSESNK